MSVGVNTGLTSVTGSVNVNASTSLPIPSATQTPIRLMGTGNGASQTVRTIAASTVFYLYGVYVQTTGYMLTELSDGTDVIELTAAGGVGQGYASAIPIAKYVAGENVKVTATNAVKYFLFGVEVPA